MNDIKYLKSSMREIYSYYADLINRKNFFFYRPLKMEMIF